MDGAEGVRGQGKTVTKGSAVVVDRSISCTWCHGSSTAEFSPVDCPGRLSALWTQGIMSVGLVVISVYLFDSEGMSDRNRRLLDAAGDHIAKLGLPWLLMGDFNLTLMICSSITQGFWSPFAEPSGLLIPLLASPLEVAGSSTSSLLTSESVTPLREFGST